MHAVGSADDRGSPAPEWVREASYRRTSAPNEPAERALCRNRAQIMPDRLFRDRRDAGRFLAGLLEEYRGRPDVMVLGLPRGGVPVAYEVATALGAPLDVFLVRKLGVPGRELLRRDQAYRQGRPF